MLASSKAVPLGYAQVTSLGAAANLPTIGSPAAIPNASTAFAVLVAESQSVRWRDDGTDPTSTVGILLPVNTEFIYTGNLGALRLIETASSAKLNVAYYRNAG